MEHNKNSGTAPTHVNHPVYVTYSLRPLRKVPNGADQSMGVQHPVHDLPLHHVRPYDRRIVGVGVLTPRRRRYGFPRVAKIIP